MHISKLFSQTLFTGIKSTRSIHTQTKKQNINTQTSNIFFKLVPSTLPLFLSVLSLLTKHIQQELLVYQFQIKESGKLLKLLCICFSCFAVSPRALWKALVVLTDQFECYLLVEKQGSDCSKHVTLVITSCYVLMKPSCVELTGHKTKSLKKKNQLTTIKPPGKTDSGQHHVE